MTTYFKVKDKVRLKSGKEGVITALDWHEGRLVSAGVEVSEPPTKDVYHVMISNIEKI